MSEPLKVGIMGCASIARRSLAPAFAAHPEFALTAIASRTPAKAAEFAAQYGARPCTYDELVAAADVDLVYCPLPTGMHYEWVKAALAAGKHVLCEKSLANNLAEVEGLVTTARQHRCLLMESFQFRFHAQNLYVKELLAKNAIGPLRQLVVRFGIPPFPDGAKNIRYSAELGGGAWLDNGAYTVKCLTYLLGPDAQVLAAFDGGATPELGNVEVTGSLMARSRPDPQLNPATDQPIPVQTAFGFDYFYQNGYELWGKSGKITTTRAFTAREDYAAPVILETAAGREVKTFSDDHFARLLDYIARTVAAGDFETEYAECLIQAKLLAESQEKAHEVV